MLDSLPKHYLLKEVVGAHSRSFKRAAISVALHRLADWPPPYMHLHFILDGRFSTLNLLLTICHLENYKNFVHFNFDYYFIDIYCEAQSSSFCHNPSRQIIRHSTGINVRLTLILQLWEMLNRNKAQKTILLPPSICFVF